MTSAGGLHTQLSGTRGNIRIAADGNHIEIEKKEHEDNPFFTSRSTQTMTPVKSGTGWAFSYLRDAVIDQTDSPIDPDEIVLSQKILFGFLQSSLNEAKGIF